MANGVTTEWEDIHVKMGNYVPREKEIDQIELNQQAIDKMEKLEDKKLDEDSDFDDEFEDDEFYKKYKEQQMAIMKEVAKKPHFGSVIEIGRDQYIQEVNQAPPESFVVIHMYQDYNENCQLLNGWLNTLAKKYPLVKFIKIIATKCIENFPDENVPCILIYKNSKCVSNLQSVEKFLNGMELINFETLLMAQSVIFNHDLVQKNEEIESYKKLLFNPNHKKEVSLEEDEQDDREYISQTLKSQKKFMKYEK